MGGAVLDRGELTSPITFWNHRSGYLVVLFWVAQRHQPSMVVCPLTGVPLFRAAHTGFSAERIRAVCWLRRSLYVLPSVAISLYRLRAVTPFLSSLFMPVPRAAPLSGSSWPEAKVEALARVLKGQPVPAAAVEGTFEIARSLPHGHVAAVLGAARELGLEELIDPEPSRQRDLVTAMAAAQVIAPDSKLAIARGLRDETAASSLGEVLGLGGCDEDDL